MNALIPWAEPMALVEPHYRTCAGGRRAIPLNWMLLELSYGEAEEERERLMSAELLVAL